MQLATLSRLAHEHFVSEELQAALEDAKNDVVDLDPDSDDARLVKVTERELRKRVKVPATWVEEHSRITATAHQDWEKARADVDFSVKIGKRRAPMLISPSLRLTWKKF
jgi:carboxypeptidase Taq